MVMTNDHKSPICTTFGINRSERDLIRSVQNVLFRAQLEQYQQSRVRQFKIK